MLGVGPYITASIIMQLLTMIFPSLKAYYYEEGEAGRAKFSRITKYLTVPLAALQGYGFLNLLMSQQVLGPLTLSQMLQNVLIITTGSLIMTWIGDMITEQKLGNGVSFIIFAGIVSGLPIIVRNIITGYAPENLPTYLAYVILAAIVIAGVVFVNEGERKIPVSYTKRIRGNRMYGGSMSYLPLKVNQAGVIPIIFAVSILLFPQFIAQISAVASPGFSIVLQEFVNKIINNLYIYAAIYFFLVFVFTYFYTSVTFDPQEISKNLQRSGGFIPGIRPGEPSGDFLKKVTGRITLFGAIFLGLIAVLPTLTQILTGVQTLTIGGTALLIVVSVALETMKQVDSQLAIREYDTVR